MIETLYYIFFCVAIAAVIGWALWQDDQGRFDDLAGIGSDTAEKSRKSPVHKPQRSAEHDVSVPNRGPDRE